MLWGDVHVAGECSCHMKKQRNIKLLGTYLDDSFGPELASNLLYYPPYCKFMPSNQVKLLQLWDEITAVFIKLGGKTSCENL